MIFNGTGLVRNGFYVLGSSAVPVYLLDGPSPVLFDGGLTCLGNVYAEAVRSVLGDRIPSLLCLTHVHFDHCGAVSHLKREFPGMKVAASERSRQILNRPNAISLIRELNSNIGDAVFGTDPDLLVHEPFEPFTVDVVVEPGNSIPLAPGLTLHALHSPGHTWDFLSFHVPEAGLLVASEAVGVMHHSGYVVTECLVSFDAYMTSLRRLAALDSEILCQAHHYVYTDGDVEDFMRKATRTAMEFHDLVEQVWEKTSGSLSKTVELIKTLEHDPMPPPRQPEAAYRINLEARIRSVLESSRGRAGHAR